MTLFWLLVVVTPLSGLTMAGLTAAYRMPFTRERRIREEPKRKLSGLRYTLRVAANGTLSGAMVFALALGLQDHLFYGGPAAAWWRYPLEFLAVLLSYDLLYYLLHRYPFHVWGPLKRVHTVHHMARYPIATDSLYIHPVETILGVLLLMTCTWMVGPVSIYSFAAAFFVYSQLNVIIHGGLDVPLVGFMARKHDQHHTSMRAGNYASITPLPDLLFGTAE